MVEIVPISVFRYPASETLFNFEWAKRSHKGLRRWVLYIVRDAPKTGAEIMDVMEGNLQGWWRPSPGSIYPLLSSMVEEGVLKRSDDKKLYSLTEKGREEVEHPLPWLGSPQSSPRSVEGALREISSYVAYLEDLKQSMGKKLEENADEMSELGSRLSKLGSRA
jgi:DNA-binding PadR family transcriptional regulator